MQATWISSWRSPPQGIMHPGDCGMAMFHTQLQRDWLHVCQHSLHADAEDCGNLDIGLAVGEPPHDVRFMRGQAKSHQTICRQFPHALLEQEGSNGPVVQIPNGAASERSGDDQRSECCRRRVLRALPLPALDHPLADLMGKSILHSGTRWPITLQEFMRAGGGPFDTSMGGDKRARLSAKFQEATMPVPLLILL
jgi:hypothetical protein